MKQSEQSENSYSNKSFRIMVIGAMIMAAIAIVTAIIFVVFINTINMVEESTADGYDGYDKHYVFIVDENSNGFWKQVYEAADASAKADKVYLEDIKNTLKVNFSNEELLRIAINSDVDGIIYAGSASMDAVKLINKAVKNGIGVVVLHNDIDKSKRQCYVGVNNYELGQVYASQILSMKKEDELRDTHVALITSAQMSEGAVNVIILAIEDTLKQSISEDNLPEISTIKINAEDTFSVEEEIRNFFLEKEGLPDVVVCLEGSYTQCVYQAVVDYNHVGDVSIIGYYENDDILEAIDKKIIYSTISVDTSEMGKSAIAALNEINEMGYTNSFTQVPMEIINKNQAAKILLQRRKASGK